MDDIVYAIGFSEKDKVINLSNKVFFKVSNSQLLTSVSTALYTVPPGRVAELYYLSVRLLPGAAQSTSSVRVLVYEPEGASSPMTIDGKRETVANPGEMIFKTGPLVLPSGYQVQAQGYFSAAANANQIFFGILGYEFPEGGLR